MGSACTYCNQDIHDHDPVFVEEGRNGGRVDGGQFCNYACLARYIEEAGLETGACCRIDLP